MAKKQLFNSLTIQAGARKSAMADITPLVNVALCLLIVFLVVMPMIQEGIPVDIPEADSAEEIVDRATEYLVLSIKEDGSLFIDLNQVQPGELRQALADAYEGKEDLPIVIKGARNLPYSEILALIEICQNVGASGVELFARRREGS